MTHYTRALDALFAPRSIAIVGASANPGKTGAQVLRALKATGYDGEIRLVSRTQPTIGEFTCFPSVRALPEPVDLAAICVPAVNVPSVIRECGEAGLRSAVVFAEGFDSPELREELSNALAEAQALSGLRMLGPNTVGVRNSASWTYVTFSWRPRGRLPAGPVATITQSGGMGTVFGKTMLRRRGLGPRYVIDTGNELDVDAAECIEYVAADPEVACISVIIEGCRDGNRLADAVRSARKRGKPVVFLKTGRSQAALQHVESHTGALAGRAEVFDAIMRDAGACVVEDERDLTDAVMLHSFGRVPKGRGLGVVTPSGGFGIMTIDAAERFGMDLPQPSVPMTVEEQRSFPRAIAINPFDMSSGVGANVQRWTAAIRWMASQPGVDAILFWQASILEDIDEQEKMYPILADAVRNTAKPIFCCGLTTPEFEDKLRKIGLLMFTEPTRLVKALSVVAPRAPSAEVVVRHDTPALARRVLTGARARAAISDLLHLKHVSTIAVPTSGDALRTMQAIGAVKAILKVESERIPHKTELGLVSAPVGPGEIALAFAQLESARNACGDPTAPIVLQPFERGVELALGGYIDPVFGPVVMVALGGIYLEILRDTAFAQAPVSEAKALEMISGLKAADILRGARGRAPANMGAIARAIAEFSRFLADNIENYVEIDINPLIAHESGVAAVDVLLVENAADKQPISDSASNDGPGLPGSTTGER